MAKHVFLSFVVEDADLVTHFRGQAKNRNSDLAFDDYSVKEPIISTSAPYSKLKIAEKIKASSLTICLIGATTATSTWVDWEVRKADELGKTGNSRTWPRWWKRGCRGSGRPSGSSPTPGGPSTSTIDRCADASTDQRSAPPNRRSPIYPTDSSLWAKSCTTLRRAPNMSDR